MDRVTLGDLDIEVAEYSRKREEREEEDSDNIPAKFSQFKCGRFGIYIVLLLFVIQ